VIEHSASETRTGLNSSVDEFLGALKKGCAACGLVGKKVLLGVSGGADSMALLRGLLPLREELYLTVCVGHLNHTLRGLESDQDAEWLQATCRSLDVPCIAGIADVAGLARERGEGSEEAARQARYDFLTQTADDLLCSHVAVGHTADDQAETILHHVLRGTGMTGLKGMSAARPLKSAKTLVRPLLSIRRREIVGYLQAIGQDYREDSSNGQTAHTRNRIRRDLFPLLEEHYNPQAREALLRLGLQAAELQDLVATLAQDLLERATAQRTATVCRLQWGELQGKSRHLVRACFVQLWQSQDWPRRNMGFDEWDRLVEIAWNGGAATLPGKIHVRRRAGLMMLEQR